MGNKREESIKNLLKVTACETVEGSCQLDMFDRVCSCPRWHELTQDPSSVPFIMHKMLFSFLQQKKERIWTALAFFRQS